MQAVVYK